MERKESGAYIVNNKTGEVTKTLPVTFKDVLRNPLDSLRIGFGVALLLGYTLLERGLNRPQTPIKAK